MVPVITSIDKSGKTEMDLFSYQFIKNRIIRLTGQIDDTLADSIIAQIDYLQTIGNDEITMYINSPGGSVSSGLAIIDAMKRSNAAIKVIVTGMAASMAAFTAAVGGVRGNRYITQNSQMMIHQPLISGVNGQASDIELEAAHMAGTKRKLNEMLAKATGKDVAEIARDSDRNYYLNASEAMSYGLVDHIM